MKNRDLWDTEKIWIELSERFDATTVDFYRRLAESPTEGFEEAKDHFKEEVARLSGGSPDIEGPDAKRRLVLAHLILAIFDGLRRGETEWKPMPPKKDRWDEEETSLLLWAAQHGMSDDVPPRADTYESEA